MQNLGFGYFRQNWTRRHQPAVIVWLGTVLLSGCMTLGDDVPPPTADEAPPAMLAVPAVEPGPPAPPVKKPARAKRSVALPRMPEKKPTAIDPAQLIGMTPQGVRSLLGSPARIRNDDMSREWVYAAKNCAFRVFFYPNLNTASFRVLKYGGSNGDGKLLDVSDACVRHILTGRKNAED